MDLEEAKKLTIEKYEKMLDLLIDGENDEAEGIHENKCAFCKRHEDQDCKAACEVFHLCGGQNYYGSTGSLYDRIDCEDDPDGAIPLVEEMIEELKKIG